MIQANGQKKIQERHIISATKVVAASIGVIGGGLAGIVHGFFAMLQGNVTPGTYLGTCAEYCGAEHAWMRIRVIAQPQADFEAWQQQQLQLPKIPTSGAAAEGEKLYTQKTCIVCHAAGIGPDLTHLGDRETIGAGVLTNTPANLAKWLKNPQAVKPGSYMPNFNLTDTEVQALVAYLEASK